MNWPGAHLFFVALAWLAPAAASTAPGGGNAFLSALLARQDLPGWMAMWGIAVAFGLGALHALSPGHGKTLVAAYLVGARGTPRHALILGATVTFTHTASVFLLGLATLFLSAYVVPERVFPVLGTISGLAIVGIGGGLFWKRLRRLGTHREHPHAHGHPHEHHYGHEHEHAAEGDVTMASLIALGASGGLVPCPSALVLLLSAIALGRAGLGLALLVAFSLGLAAVLIAIGLLALYARNLLPDRRQAAQHPAWRVIPVVSAALIVAIGAVLTGASLGWIRY